MGVRVTSPSRAGNGVWPVALAGGILALLLSVSLVASGALRPFPPGGSTPVPSRIAYFQFGPDADTLWLADPDSPSRRERLLVVPHAREFGVVPRLAPDGRRFVYAALPSETRAPRPETPAGLWLSDVAAGAEPRLLARDIDLLVPAVWSMDGESVVFRRSGPEYRLVLLNLTSGQEQDLVRDASGALFPVAFAPDDGRLYYVRLSGDGSFFVSVDVDSDEKAELARLSPGLTRDWTLSATGDQLAYLEMDLSDGQVSSRAAILDLTTGAIETAEASGDAFGPVWGEAGTLLVGRLTEGDAAAGLYTAAGAIAFTPPAQGFDVPLMLSSAGEIAVRSFDGDSAMAPGRPSLAIVATDGTRKTIATGEVTFLGWIEP
jgi:hypothetical protein